MRQLKFFRQDLIKMLGKNKWRIFVIFFSRVFVGIFWYRVDRALYLLVGEKYKILRIIFTPFFYVVQAYSNLDIHYQSDIGPGLLILHSSPGIVISGKAIIGKNLTLTGGNVIGRTALGEFKIGDNCLVGANACIIGPLLLGNHIVIGACACVVKSFPGDNLTLVGVPAKVLLNKKENP